MTIYVEQPGTGGGGGWSTGATGPTGPAGTGATGPAGPTGPTGPSGGGGGGSNPFSDDTPLIFNEADNTKQARIDAAFVPTATENVYSLPTAPGVLYAYDGEFPFAAFDGVFRLGNDVANSAGSADISYGGDDPFTGGQYLTMSGSGNVNSLGSGPVVPNPYRIVRFTSVVTLKHNPSLIILPTSADIVVAAGDIGTFVYEGDDVSSFVWRCIGYQRASGAPLAGGGGGGGLTTDVTSFSRSITDTSGTVSYNHNLGVTPGLIQFSFSAIDDAFAYIITGSGSSTLSENYSVVLDPVNGISDLSMANCLVGAPTSGWDGQYGAITAWDSTTFTVTWTKLWTPAAGTMKVMATLSA